MKKYLIRLVDDVLEISFRGEMFEQDVTNLKTEIIELSKDGPYKILVNMKGVPADTGVPVNLREYFKDLPFKRYAIFGGAHPIMLPLKELVDSLPENPNFKFFRTEEDARAWLSSQDK